jgi:hypothetical protein
MRKPAIQPRRWIPTGHRLGVKASANPGTVARPY